MFLLNKGLMKDITEESAEKSSIKFIFIIALALVIISIIGVNQITNEIMLIEEKVTVNSLELLPKLTQENNQAREDQKRYEQEIGNDLNSDAAIKAYDKPYIEEFVHIDSTEVERLKDRKKVNIVIENESDKENEEKLKSYALSSLLMDRSSGRVLYEDNGYTKMPMASTTKIMTCIIALENGNYKDIVNVSSLAASMPNVQLHAKKDDQFYLEDLLYSLMLESHNDVAVAIAEHIGGSVEGFAQMMNDKAKELGCTNTNFVTANGLDALGHETTAVELAKIAVYALENEEFIKITNTPSKSFTEIKTGKNYIVHNKNGFLYSYEGAMGVKTGFTNKAGYCFVGAVEKDGKGLVSVVLGSGWPPNRNYKWKDTSTLMNYGLNNYEMKQIFNYGKYFEPILIDKGKQKYLNIYYHDDIVLLINNKENIKIIYEIPKVLKAPVMKDSIVGIAKYYVEDDFVKGVEIRAVEGIDQMDFRFCLEYIFNIMFLNFES